MVSISQPKKTRSHCMSQNRRGKDSLDNKHYNNYSLIILSDYLECMHACVCKYAQVRKSSDKGSYNLNYYRLTGSSVGSG